MTKLTNRLTVYCGFVVGILGAVESRSLFAQEPTERGWVNVNAIVQGTTHTFSDRVQFATNSEEGEIFTEYAVRRNVVIDVMGGVRLWRYIGVGVGVMRSSQAGVSNTSTARVPHPFYFRRHRQVTGPTATDRTDTQIDIHGTAILPTGRRVRVMVFGGPTVVQVQQGLVTGVTTRDSYPYNTVTFQSYTKQRHNVSAIGFNVGVDVSYFFSDYIGVGGLVRYSRATVDFTAADGDTLQVVTGGPYVGGGLRIKF